jgi:hypothetical protein
MNRREMIKMAYQAPPKNEVIDEIDMLFKKAAISSDPQVALAREWTGILQGDKGIAKSLSKLPPNAKQSVLDAMVANLTSQSGQSMSPLAKEVSTQTFGALQSGGYLPSGASSKLGQRALGATTKALGAAAPIMLAGAGLYGLSGLINYVKEKSKAKKFEAAKANAFESLAKDPALRGVDKKELKQVFDLYADVSPLVTEHPILASSVLRDLGGTANAANTNTLKTLSDLYNSKMKTEAEIAKAKNLGWTSVSSDPTKIRALIRE